MLLLVRIINFYFRASNESCQTVTRNAKNPNCSYCNLTYPEYMEPQVPSSVYFTL